jgi:hypothetical protein
LTQRSIYISIYRTSGPASHPLEPESPDCQFSRASIDCSAEFTAPPPQTGDDAGSAYEGRSLSEPQPQSNPRPRNPLARMRFMTDDPKTTRDGIRKRARHGTLNIREHGAPAASSAPSRRSATSRCNRLESEIHLGSSYGHIVESGARRSAPLQPAEKGFLVALARWKVDVDQRRIDASPMSPENTTGPRERRERTSRTSPWSLGRTIDLEVVKDLSDKN